MGQRPIAAMLMVLAVGLLGCREDNNVGRLGKAAPAGAFALSSPDDPVLLSESGAPVAVSVALSARPAGNVAALVSSPDTTELLITTASVSGAASGTLTFTPGNWKTPQTVTLEPVDDAVADGNQTLSLAIVVDDSGTSDGSGYASAAPVELEVVVQDDDTVNVAVIETSGTTRVSETGTSDTVRISLGSKPTGNVAIDATIADTTEALLSDSDETDEVSVRLTFTKGNWNTAQTITVTGQDDPDPDGSQNVNLTVDVASGATGDDTGYKGLGPQSITVTVLDDEVPVLDVQETGASTVLSEAGGLDTIWVGLSTPPDGDVVITVTSQDTSEALVSDDNESGLQTVTLTFTTGNYDTPQPVSVEGQNEFFIDGDQPVTIVVAVDGTTADTTGYALLADVNLVATVQDDDAPAVTITETGGSTFVLEEFGTDTFDVVLASVPDGDVVIRVTSPDPGEAVLSDGDETQTTPITLTFTPADWSTAQTVTVVGFNEFFQDGHQTFDLTVRVVDASTNDTTGYEDLPDQTVSVTVLDFDTAGMLLFESGGGSVLPEVGGTDTFDVALSGLPDGNVVVRITSNDTSELVLSDGDETSTSPVTLTFTPADWETAQTVTMEAVDEFEPDGDQAVQVSVQIDVIATTDTTGYDGIPLQFVNATVQDDDAVGITFLETGGNTTFSENGGTDLVSVQLGSLPTDDVVITLTSSDIGEAVLTHAAEIDQQTVTLTFDTVNWDTPQNVTVEGVNEEIADGNQPVTLTLAVDSIATLDASGYGALPNQVVTATVQDDDTPGLTITETLGSTVLAEDGGTDTFDVELNTQPDDTVVITITSPDPDEAVLSDGNETDKPVITLTFDDTDWDTRQTVTVTGVDDLLADGSQVFNLSLAVDGATQDNTGYAALSPQSLSITVTDEDTAGLVIVAAGGTTLSENGGTDTFTVKLSSQPSGSVAVTVTSPDISEALLSDADQTDLSAVLLSFDDINWDTVQTVTVTGQDDPNADGNQVFDITVDVTGGTDATGYLVLATENVSTTVNDDDTASLSIVQSGGTTVLPEEPPGNDSFTVELTSVPLGPVNVTVTSQDASEAVLTDANETGQNPITLSFDDTDWDTPQTVTVVGVDDDIADGDQNFNVTLTVAAGSTAEYLALGTSNVGVQVTDDDMADVVFTETDADTAVNEDGDTDTFDVVLTSEPVGIVNITVASLDTSEVVLTDANETGQPSVTLTFDDTDWDTPQTVTVVGAAEFVDDGNQNITVTVDVNDATTTDNTGYTSVSLQNVGVAVTDNDTAGFTVGIPGGDTTVNEDGGTDTITVKLNSEPVGDVVIDVDSIDITELDLTVAGQPNQSTVTLTFDSSDWDTDQIVTVEGVLEAIDDGNQTVDIDISVNAPSTDDPLYDVLGMETIQALVVDNDTIGVTVSQTGGTTVLPELGTDTINVRLNSEPVTTVDILVSSGDTSEAVLSAGVQSSQNTVTLNFDNTNWMTNQPVTVEGVDDRVDDGNQTFDVTVSVLGSGNDLAYQGLGPQNVSTTVQDIDAAGITVTEPCAIIVSELGGTDSFDVVLNSKPTGTVLIDVNSLTPTEAVLSAGVQSGLDTVTLTFDDIDWETPQTVTVEGVPDANPDGSQSITIEVDPVGGTDGSGYPGLATQNVSATVLDADAEGIVVIEPDCTTALGEATNTTDTLDVHLSAPPDGTVEVTVSSPAISELLLTGAGQTSLDAIVLTFTIGDWQTKQTVTLEAQNDLVDDDDQTFDVGFAVTGGSHSTYTGITAAFNVTVVDNDTARILFSHIGGGTTVNEDGSSDTLNVRLATQPIDPVVVQVSSPDDTEAKLSDDNETDVTPISLSFDDTNWNTNQIVTVVPQDDLSEDGDTSFNLTLSIDVAATDDAVYDTVGNRNVPITVQDDDTANITIAGTGGSTVLSEESGTDSFTLELSTLPLGTVDVVVTSNDASEARLTDADETTQTSITIPFTNLNWNNPQLVTVVGWPDDIDDGTQSFNLTVSVGGGSATEFAGVAPQNVPVQVTDDDTADITITEPGGSTELAEDGGIDTFDVSLTSEPTSTVNITVTSTDTGEAVLSDGNEFLTSPITLSFTALNWSVAQTVTVTGAIEFIADGDQTFDVNLAVNDGTTPDPVYQGVGNKTVSVTVQDNDAPGVTITESGGSTALSELTVDTIQIKLASEPDDVVDVTVTSGDTTEALLTDSNETLQGTVTLNFTPGDWDTNQLVTVEGVQDFLIDADQNFDLTVAVNDPTTDDTTGYTGLADQLVAVSVQNSDSPGITIVHSGGDTTLSENGGTDIFTVSLASIPDNAVEIDITSPDISEALLTDAGETEEQEVTLFFNPCNWSTPQPVTVVGQDDMVIDGNQAFNLTVVVDDINTLDTTGYDDVSDQNVPVTVQDDDSASITITQTGGTTSLAENGGVDTFDVELSSQPDDDVVLTVTSGDPGEALVSDLGESAATTITLIFDGTDWQTPQTVTVEGVDDDIADGTQVFNITVAVDTDLTLDSTGFLGATPRIISTSVTDEDAASVVIIEEGGSTVVAEDGGMDTFTVELGSEPSAVVNITVTSGDSGEALLTHAPDTDVASLNLSFGPGDWDTPQTVTVVGAPEFVDDGNQMFDITVDVNDGTTLDNTGYTSVAPQNVPVTVQDNDTAGFTVTATDGSTVLSESMGMDTISVVLNTRPLADVDISVTSPRPDEAVLTDANETLADSVLLTFTPADWSTAQDVDVEGVPEFVADGDQTFDLTVAIDATSDTTGYAMLGSQTTEVTVQDDDAPGMTIVESSGGTGMLENGGFDDFTVRLASQPDGVVEITVTSGDTSECVLSHGGQTEQETVTLTFDENDWDTPKTVTTLGVDDAIQDFSVDVTITLAIGGGTLDNTGYQLLASEFVTATVVSDE